MEIVKLIGSDVLPDDQKLVIETAKVIRVGFLQQNAYHAEDTYVPLEKQLGMMKVILYLYDQCAAMIKKGHAISAILETGIFGEAGQDQVRCTQRASWKCWTITTPRSTRLWLPSFNKGGASKV